MTDDITIPIESLFTVMFQRNAQIACGLYYGLQKIAPFR